MHKNKGLQSELAAVCFVSTLARQPQPPFSALRLADRYVARIRYVPHAMQIKRELEELKAVRASSCAKRKRTQFLCARVWRTPTPPRPPRCSQRCCKGRSAAMQAKPKVVTSPGAKRELAAAAAKVREMQDALAVRAKEAAELKEKLDTCKAQRDRLANVRSLHRCMASLGLARRLCGRTVAAAEPSLSWQRAVDEECRSCTRCRRCARSRRARRILTRLGRRPAPTARRGPSADSRIPIHTTKLVTGRRAATIADGGVPCATNGHMPLAQLAGMRGASFCAHCDFCAGWDAESSCCSSRGTLSTHRAQGYSEYAQGEL